MRVARSTARDRAERALGVHALGAADAMQLAAALVVVGHRPKRRPLVVAEPRLAEAARREGFNVIVPGSQRPSQRLPA